MEDDDRIAKEIQSNAYYIVGSLWLIASGLTDNWMYALPAFANFLFMILTTIRK